MTNWQTIIRERLASSKLPPDQREQIVSELTAHLEDCHAHACALGIDAAAATELALHELEEVNDWPALAARLGRAKSQEVLMNRRTKTLWLPGIAILFVPGLILVFLNRAALVQRFLFVACAALLFCAAATESSHLNQRTRSLWLPALTTLFGASLSLMLCQFLGMRPRILWVGKDAIPLYWPWLLTLPIFGAAGTRFSMRHHGPVFARVAAGLSPALIMLTVMCLIFPWGLAIDGFHFFQLVSFRLSLISWVALPALALLIGAAPFLRGAERSEEVAAHV